MKREVIGGLALVVLVVVFITTIAAFQSTQAENSYSPGNADCGGTEVDTRDVLFYLAALAGTSGVPIDCSYQLQTWLPCDPGPAPSTNCDAPTAYYPTTAPGDPLPGRLDFNCDGQKNVLDALGVLNYSVFGGPLPTACPSLHPSASPP